MERLINLWQDLVDRLDGLGHWLAPLALRLVLFWEFFEAGREKFGGSNWFMDIQGRFPFPFNQVPSELSWAMATWFELIGAIALLVGLATRFFAFSLAVLTFVAIAAVHWPDNWMMFSELAQGYAITDRGHGNYKLPLLFLVMLLPLILRGAGKLSLDALLAKLLRADIPPQPNADGYAWGLFAIAFGLPLAMLLPTFGLALAGAGILLLVATRWLRM